MKSQYYLIKLSVLRNYKILICMSRCLAVQCKHIFSLLCSEPVTKTNYPSNQLNLKTNKHTVQHSLTTSPSSSAAARTVSPEQSSSSSRSAINTSDRNCVIDIIDLNKIISCTTCSVLWCRRTSINFTVLKSCFLLLSLFILQNCSTLKI